jgi:hypothetical protein
VKLRCACNGPRDHGVCPGALQRNGHGVNGCAGRDDVVDDGEPEAFVTTVRRESVRDVCAARRAAQRALRRRCFAASNPCGSERDVELGGDRARDFFGLIVAALAEALGVQRHGDQCVGALSAAVELGGEQQPERATKHACTIELERVQLPVERRCIHVRSDERVDVPWVSGPRAAADRECQAALAAGRGNARKILRAACAEPARGVAAAARATLGEESSQPVAVNRHGPLRLTVGRALSILP